MIVSTLTGEARSYRYHHETEAVVLVVGVNTGTREYSQHLTNDTVPTIQLLDLVASGRPERLRLLWLEQEIADAIRHDVWRVGRDDVAGSAIVDDLRHRVVGRADAGDRVGHRLKKDIAPGLAA